MGLAWLYQHRLTDMRLFIRHVYLHYVTDNLAGLCSFFVSKYGRTDKKDRTSLRVTIEPFCLYQSFIGYKIHNMFG